MYEFCTAALPWIACGLCLALFFAFSAKKKKDAEYSVNAVEGGEQSKEDDMNYTSFGMALGMCFGVAFSTAFHMNLGLGISLGLLIGLAIGSSMDKKK